MLPTVEPEALRVLVVDDDLNTLDTTATLLRLIGYKVEMALNGRHALAYASTFQPHVVMLDLSRPAMDGYETAREFQRLRSPPVLIAVIGYGDIHSRRVAAEAGFDLCLKKPIDPGIYEELFRLVEQSGQLRGVHARLNRLRANTRRALRSLAIGHLQTAHTMLYVAGTTANESTKACCLAKTRRICDRLAVWIKRYSYLRALRDDLEHLIRQLPES